MYWESASHAPDNLGIQERDMQHLQLSSASRLQLLRRRRFHVQLHRKCALPSRWRSAEVGLWTCLVALGASGTLASSEARDSTIPVGSGSMAHSATVPRRLGDSGAVAAVACATGAYIFLLTSCWCLYAFTYARMYGAGARVEDLQPQQVDEPRGPKTEPEPTQPAVDEPTAEPTPASNNVEIQKTTSTPLPVIEEEGSNNSEGLEIGKEGHCASIPLTVIRNDETVWGRGDYAVSACTGVLPSAPEKLSALNQVEDPQGEGATNSNCASWCRGMPSCQVVVIERAQPQPHSQIAPSYATDESP